MQASAGFTFMLTAARNAASPPRGAQQAEGDEGKIERCRQTSPISSMPQKQRSLPKASCPTNQVPRDAHVCLCPRVERASGERREQKNQRQNQRRLARCPRMIQRMSARYADARRRARRASGSAAFALLPLVAARSAWRAR